MAIYSREYLNESPALSPRRPTINEYFLSSYTLSIYAGCELGCPYCDGWAYTQRPLTETVRVPLDLPQRLSSELERVDRGDLIAITALSDPYQPVEQSHRITRQTLQVLADRGQPTLLLTKSPDVLQDVSLFQKIHERSLGIVMTTLLTVDPHLSEQLEGKAPLPGVRLAMLRELKRAGIPVGVALVPVMPYVTDSDLNLRSVLRACAEAEVDFVVWDYLHIPNERHRARVGELMMRLASYPPSYLRDIYQGQATVGAGYRHERDTTIITRCDGLGLEIRPPHHLYAGRINQNNEIALLLKHAAFRDRVQGRDHIADLHREIAEQAYRGAATQSDLKRSAIWPSIREVLERR